MNEFFRLLNDPHGGIFLRQALVVALAASVAFGIMGTYVVAKRISSLAGAIAHSALGGIGAAHYLQKKMDIAWFEPLHGALVAALLSAFLIGFVILYAREREDTIISAIWVTGMSLGLILLKLSGAKSVDMMSYVLGDILLVSPSDLWLLLALDTVVVALALIYYSKFVAICFDQEFAELRGVHVRVYYFLMLALVAISIILLMNLVGIVLVIALLVLPAAFAARFANRLHTMMALSILACMAFVTIGMGVSVPYDIPTGACIAAVAAAAYFIVLVVDSIQRRVSRSSI
ncbi:MAG: metal ABC transporter permease [Verrucomicrobia bacterium]|nr:metal ABC transporter permease [Verrucomicrobiota bacterium]